VAWLCAQFRAGVLSQDRIRLGVYLEDPGAEAAARALGTPALRFLPPADVPTWVHALPGFWGGDLVDEDWDWLLQVYHRVGAALVRGVCLCFPEGPRQEQALVVSKGMERWIVTRFDQERDQALEHLHELQQEAAPRGLLRVFRRRTGRLLSALGQASMTLAFPTIHINAGHEQAASFLANERSPEWVRELVREDLLPWAMGRSDPIAARG
tara:strand:+ start:42 stop:674 length:633 start_codon:yes stop_codon:yes gene_type:complete